MRMSHDFPANVAYFHFHSYNSRTTFVMSRMSFSFIFSPDSREVLACFLKTVARQSDDTRTPFIRVSQNFRIVNSPGSRHSHDRRTTVAR